MNEILGDVHPIDNQKLTKQLNEGSVHNKRTKSAYKSAYNFNVHIQNLFDTPKNKVLRIPPITIISATHFSNAIAIVCNVSGDKYTEKYVSVGVQIQLNELDHYNTIKN